VGKLNSFKTRKVAATTAATLIFGLVGAGTALADDSASLPAYGGPGGPEQGIVDQGTPTTPQQMVLPTTAQGNTAPDTSGNEVLGVNASGGSAPAKAAAPTSAPAAAPAATNTEHRVVGSLPFTGLDLMTVVLVGLVLLALGFGLRRLTSAPPQAS
jgi:hypothetical protein